MDTITISTPQNIDIEYQLGSLGDRIVGALIDAAIIFAYVIIIVTTTAFTNAGGRSFNFIMIALAIPVVFYDLASELLLNGQSVGKKVMGIRVTSLSGEQPSFSQYLIRWIFRLIDFTLTGQMLGLIMVAATEKKQRLGDIIAGTVLVKTKARAEVTDTLFNPNSDAYMVTYPDVASLTDNDIQLLREVVLSVYRSRNLTLALHAQQKIEQTLAIKSRDDDPFQFLQTVIADYNYLTSQV